MRLLTRVALAALVLPGAPLAALAFNLSPCLRVLTLEQGELQQEPIRSLNRCELLPIGGKLNAVHEHQTIATIRKYRGDGASVRPRHNGWAYEYMDDNPWKVSNGRTHQTENLIFGTWWNDDPVMRSWGQGWDFLKGSGHAVWTLPAARYGGGTRYCMVDKEHYLGLATHEGAMQHLHFMFSATQDATASTPEERVKTTTYRALTWMEFAYGVATGTIKPSDAVPENLGLPERWHLNHCTSDRRVLALFSRVSPSALDHKRFEQVPDVALGTMLHLIQDSFSPSHTCRLVRGEGRERTAVLADVFDYSDPQHDRDRHSELDQHPVWIMPLVQSLDARRDDPVMPIFHTYKNDPVAVGAMLLEAVDKGRAWPEVREVLLSTVFARASSEDRGLSCIR